MWYFVLLAIVLAGLVVYVSVRDKHHPVNGPPQGDGRGWGNLWPR